MNACIWHGFSAGEKRGSSLGALGHGTMRSGPTAAWAIPLQLMWTRGGVALLPDALVGQRLADLTQEASHQHWSNRWGQVSGSLNSQVFEPRHGADYYNTVRTIPVVYLFNLFLIFNCSRQAGLRRRGFRARRSYHRVKQVLKHGGWILAITRVHRRCLDYGASGCNQPVEALPL
jgi:hypothetical protein